MTRFFLLWLFIPAVLGAAYLHFDQYRLTGAEKGDTLLVIGGVHGNEPGAYFSAAILAAHYKVQKGALWVVPNLNFDSLVRDQRGIYGDMNRKFAVIDPKDRDYAIIEDIKKVIVDPQVSLILNLHDGHGFYRRTWKNAIFNPSAWGQACIIDQKCITAQKYGNLDEIASAVSRDINGVLSQEHHAFRVKNTKTKFKDEQMRLSLTYFAVRHAKPAFAIETSKNIFELEQKVFYQLHAVEAFMRQMGIVFTRDFKLTRREVRRLLEPKGQMTINGKVLLDLDDPRPQLNFVPFKRSGNVFEATHPLAALYPDGGQYRISVGHQAITRIRPQFFRFDDSLPEVDLVVDGSRRRVPMPSIVDVGTSFSVQAPQDYRVNIIGFSRKGQQNENAMTVRYRDLVPRFSLDNGRRIFRVEFYRNGDFCGMIGVRFGDGAK